MMMDQPFLFHAIISPYLNIGLLKPLDVCKKAEKAFLDGRAPLNSVEGFIRQIIGWREYIRGIYFLQGPNYTQNNYLDHNRPLPSLYWGQKVALTVWINALNKQKILVCTPYSEINGHWKLCITNWCITI